MNYAATPKRGDCINLFGMRIDRTTMADSVAAVLGWCREPRGEACRFVVTPNTDHAVVYQQHAGLRAAYADASMVLADGTPLVVAANFFGKNLPERVAGSDLVPQFFAGACGRPCRRYRLAAATATCESIYSARRQASQKKRGIESKLIGRASASLARIHRRSASKPILKKMPGSLPPCGRSSRTSSLLGSVRRGRSFGFINISASCPRRLPFAPGRRSTFWPVTNVARQSGCAVWGSNGYIGCARNHADWRCVTRAMPGCCLNCFGVNGVGLALNTCSSLWFSRYIREDASFEYPRGRCRWSACFCTRRIWQYDLSYACAGSICRGLVIARSLLFSLGRTRANLSRALA